MCLINSSMVDSPNKIMTASKRKFVSDIKDTSPISIDHSDYTESSPDNNFDVLSSRALLNTYRF